MKNTLILIFAISLTIYLVSCGNDNNTVTPPPVNPKPTMSGKIENWSLGTGKKLYLIAYNADTSVISYTLDSCNIDSQGNFTINMSTPPDTLLVLFSVYDSMCTHHTVINPSGLRFCYADFIVMDSLYFQRGLLYRSSDSSHGYYTGKINGYVYYFNASGSIAGIDTCITAGITLIENTQVSQAKGWNSLYLIYDSVNVNFIRLSVTAQQQNVKWYMQADSMAVKHGDLYRRDSWKK